MITGLRVTYYSEDRGPLLADCLLPLAVSASTVSGVERAWIQTHWLYGPHTVLYFQGTQAAVHTLREQCAVAVRGYLAEHPSTTLIDADAFEVSSVELGRLELVEPPYAPLRPDNTVDLESETLTGDSFLRGLGAVEGKGEILAAALSTLPFDLFMRREPSENLLSVFKGMASLATNYPGWGLISGYQAFLSHWKEYFYWADGAGEIEAALAGSFSRQQDQLVSLLEALNQRDPELLRNDPEAQAWLSWFDASLPVARQLAATAQVLPYPHPERLEKASKFGAAVRVQWSGSADRDYSDFHRSFRRLDFSLLGTDTDFASYRFLINCFFELLPLMQISPIQRYSVAYFLTTAAQIVVDEPWEVTIERAIERQSSNPQAQPTLPWRGEAHE